MTDDDIDSRSNLYKKPDFTPAPARLVEQRPGFGVFTDILLKAQHCWDNPPTPDRARKFVEYALIFTNTSTHKFRKALDILAQTSDKFPSIAALKDAVHKIPKAPIDFQDKLDARESCNLCGSTGTDAFIHIETLHECYVYCSCKIGEYMQERGTKGLATAKAISNQGYMRLKSWRRMK